MIVALVEQISCQAVATEGSLCAAPERHERYGQK
jgi:hypothetical protein